MKQKVYVSDTQEKEIEDLLNPCCVRDHALLRVEHKCNLIIHGNPKGYIVYNQCRVTFKDVARLVRDEYNIPDDYYLDIVVSCCYGTSQKPYSDNYNYIRSNYDNEDKLYLEFYCNDISYWCIFEYNNSSTSLT